jgi:hypothetical protein
VAAVAITAILLALVVCDLEIARFREWWERHSLTGSILASLLVVGVTGLIFDELIARYQRRERASSVAVQALIVYSQARRAYDAVLASDEAELSDTHVADEVRPLASMLLSASPSLFDDPVARVFLERVQQLMGAMVRTIAASPEARGDITTLLADEMTQLQASVEPLRARLPAEYRSTIDDEHAS